MRTSLRHAAGLAAVLLVGTSVASANLLSNAGFEDPIAPAGPPFTGRWEPFNGGGAFSVNAPFSPRSGLLHGRFGIDNTVNTFAGAFQDVTGLTPGTPVSFSGYQATPSSPLNVGVEFRIEWRNFAANSEISRTPNQTTAPTGVAYTLFNLDSTVPAGADTARVVYAIQSFSTNPLGNGEVYVDDLSFTVVPEPASLGLLAGAGMLIARRRRA